MRQRGTVPAIISGDLSRSCAKDEGSGWEKEKDNLEGQENKGIARERVRVPNIGDRLVKRKALKKGFRKKTKEGRGHGPDHAT